MKILRLTIRNIASVSTAVIDFDRPPLADADVFLISGSVGSGKSTLLDCICLALYGGTPRLNPSAKGEDADTARIMREGTADSAVTLDFIANDLTPCRASWSRRRARGRVGGALQKAEWRLTVNPDTACETTYTRRTEVAEEIRKAVGLGYHDFCRTTMLAQGQFASFLKGSDDDKAGILEKLTGTQRYARIGKNISLAFREAVDACSREEAVLASIPRLPADELVALAASLESEKLKAAAADLRADSLRAALAWIETDLRLRQARSSAVEALSRARAASDDPQALGRRRFIALWENSAQARAADAMARAADDERRTVESEISGLSRDVLRLREAYALVSDNRSLAPLEEALAASQGALDAAASAASAASAALADATREYAVARSIHVYAAEIALMADLNALSLKKRRLGEIDRAMPGLNARLEEAGRKYSSAAMTSDQLVEKIRASLAPGDICPVCGSAVVGKVCAEALYDEYVLPRKKVYESLLREVDEMRGEAAALSAEITASSKACRERADALEAEKTQFAAEQTDAGLWFELPDAASQYSLADANFRLAQAAAAKEKARKADECAARSLADAKLKAADADAQLSSGRATLEKRRAVLEPLLRNLAAARPEWFETRDILPAKSFDDALMTEAHGFHARFMALDGRRTAARASAETHRRAVDAFISDRNMDRAVFDSLCRASEADVEALRIADKALADAVTAAKATLADIERDNDAHAAARPASLDSGQSAEEIAGALKAAVAEADAARLAMGRIQASIDTDEMNARRCREITDALMPLCRRRDLLARLNEMFGSADGKKFRTIAQSYVLANLIHSANHYMRSLMPRYRLVGTPNTYHIDVEDAYDGYARRSAKHISGGETFVVSLALALALADIGTSLGVDTLFIDEGFGSLSGKALEDAVETLRALRRRGGRRVGIISHIESLRDRIPVRIDVTQTPGRNTSAYNVTEA